MRSLRASAPASLAAAGLLISLAACGTTESPDSTSDDSTADSGPVTVTDARGEEVVLEDGPATNVVALEWMEAENLVTLGVMPAGVADVSGYGTWVTASPLDDTVTDVGTRQEPSADAIIDLEPDLIILEEDRDAALVEQLERYAPVLVVKGSDASNNIEQMKTNFEMIAQAVGKEDEAETILAEFDTALAEGKAAIEDAGAAGQGFVMADGWTEGSTVNIRMFGKGSLFSDLAEGLGLQNQWTGEVDPAWGLGQTDVEGLNGLGDLHFFYHQTGEDPWIDGLSGNAIWTALPFVQSGQVHPLEPGTWTFGGPASCEQFIDQVVQAVA